jgi:hypothetical protein
MASQVKRKRRTLHDLSKNPVTLSDIESAYNELEHGSDRSAAIVGCAFVQHALCLRIISSLKCTDSEIVEKLYAPNGPLSTFFGQIQLANAMGLIDKKSWGSLETIRRVRNVFAHVMAGVTFSTPEIAAECLTLGIPGILPSALRKKQEIQSNPRYLYVFWTIHLMFHFMKSENKRLKSKAKRLKIRSAKMAYLLTEKNKRVSDLKTSIAKLRRQNVEQRSRNIQLIEGLVLKSNIPTVEKLFTENLPSERKEYLQSIFVALRKRYPHLA